MRVLVVGGSGFVGTRLIRRFKRSNIQINNFDKNNSFEFSSLTSIGDVRSYLDILGVLDSVDTIINLAAEHRDDVTPKSLYYDVNVRGAENICAAARVKGINRIIFTSSVAVYGFAEVGTDEAGAINPFNDYGKTKYQAEEIFRKWQSEDAVNRTLVVIRPTVIFGEQNRGNVYNLLKQISIGRFLMIGNGCNRKSIAYVENVCAFIEYCFKFEPGVHVYNYIDKPDFDMNTLVTVCRKHLSQGFGVGPRIPYFCGLLAGYGFDFLAFIMRRKLPISSIRVKKFCANSVYKTAIDNTGFVRPVSINDALKSTLIYEFIEDNSESEVFYTE
jgi:nucleoside-diphosphate-sugar epimerase